MRRDSFVAALERLLLAARLREVKLESGLFHEVTDPSTGQKRLQRLPKSLQPRCGARCRDGHACQARAVFGKSRCRLHGGASTGPKTAAGKQRIAESNRRRGREKKAQQK